MQMLDESKWHPTANANSSMINIGTNMLWSDRLFLQNTHIIYKAQIPCPY